MTFVRLLQEVEKLKGISEDLLVEVLRNMIKKFNQSNLSPDLLGAITRIISQNRNLPNKVRLEILSWVFCKSEKKQSHVEDVIEELGKLACKDKDIAKETIPHFEILVLSGSENALRNCVIQSARILHEHGSKESFLPSTRHYLNVMTNPDACKQVSGMFIKMILKVLFDLKISPYPALEKLAKKGISDFLKWYDFYKSPLLPLEFAVYEDDETWETVWKKLPFIKYPKPSEIFEGLHAMRFSKGDERVNERITALMHHLFNKKLLLSYGDYREIEKYIFKNKLGKEFKLRLSPAGKKKMEILRRLE